MLPLFQSFQPNPEVACSPAEFDPAVHKAIYRYNYPEIFTHIAKNPKEAQGILRSLCKTDRFFLAYFVANWESDKVSGNKPYIVSLCRELEEGPQDGTIDVHAREHGKAIDLHEPVLTTRGWKAHGSLEVGDYVYSPGGKPVMVQALSHVWEDDPCYQVILETDSVVVNENHQWEVWYKSGRTVSGTHKRLSHESKLVSTRELFEHHHKPDNRWSVSVNKPLDMPYRNLLVDPYVLGVWLGDGSSQSPRVTCGIDDADEAASNLRDRGYSVKKTYHSNAVTLSLGNGVKNRPGNNLAADLKTLGVYKNKHVPSNYLIASLEQRLLLLQGLMDTDGYVNPRGTAYFVNINERISRAVFDLAASLGMRPSFQIRNKIVNGAPYPVYQVTFQAYKSMPPFRMARKLERCKDGSPLPRRQIVDVIPVKSRATSCIQVEGGLYLVGKSLITTHNSACITIAGTLQRILNNPECTTAIFSFRKSSAEKFLESIKHMLESDFMKWLFPDICYENTNQTQWSVQNGIRVKRVNQAMKEHTVEAFGLIEGMPTGGHYDHRIYDDIETEDMASSPDQMQLCFDKLMMSRYLGRDGGTEQVIGTYYSHFGTIVKLKEVKDIYGEPLYLLRLKPGTDDGTVTGKPVFFSQKYLDSKKVDMRTFNTQILCNPTPQSEIKLDFSRFNMIERKDLPKDRIKFVIIDPAGDKEVQSGSGNDSWAMLCCSVRPYIDELGNSDVYIEDGIVSELGLSAAIDAGCNLYIRNGRIGILGIEKVANDTTYRHIQNALTARGRYLELKKGGKYGGNLMLLSPSGRSKNYRIETALAWPLNNSKLHYTDDLDIDIVARLKEECNKFPYFHVDMLDALAYVYDILADPTCAYNFGMEEDEDDWEEEDMATGRSDVTGY
jgi:hypothetical protein